MKKLTAKLVIALLGMMALPSAILAQLKVGEAYPDFILPRIDNREAVALSDFRGKKVLLIQFASW